MSAQQPIRKRLSERSDCIGQYRGICTGIQKMAAIIGSASIISALPPGARVTMTYPVSTQPQMVQLISTTSATSSWNSDVFDCCDDFGVCLCGTFFPVCLACSVASDYGECCCLPVVGGGVLAMRTGIRERHRIPGTICNDCVCLTFCGPCTLCQMKRELKARK